MRIIWHIHVVSPTLHKVGHRRNGIGIGSNEGSDGGKGKGKGSTGNTGTIGSSFLSGVIIERLFQVFKGGNGFPLKQAANRSLAEL
jgi:hypothetical protein